MRIACRLNCFSTTCPRLTARSEQNKSERDTEKPAASGPKKEKGGEKARKLLLFVGSQCFAGFAVVLQQQVTQVARSGVQVLFRVARVGISASDRCRLDPPS